MFVQVRTVSPFRQPGIVVLGGLAAEIRCRNWLLRQENTESAITPHEIEVHSFHGRHTISAWPLKTRFELH